MKMLKSFILLSLIFYLSLLLFMYIFQRAFMYHPKVRNTDPTTVKFKYHEVYINSETDIKLRSWYSYSDQNKKTILFFHGNAGELGARIYKLNKFNDLNLNFLIISWRGFSGNNGKPTEQGLYKDAQKAVEWLEEKGINKKDIILYGESLGTGIAVELATKGEYSGIILESPYTSMIDMGKRFYPFLPISILQKDKYNSLKKLNMITSPILVLHGKSDTLVPFYMGKKIYDEANEPKYYYFPDLDNHMMTYDQNMLKTLSNFVNEISKQ
ncbi:MAG: alpha/beta hydrolase [Candidatus Pelagibacter sp.]|nr:alpha/beta hydrolase [Candidatus Pelagibacter sp.]OUV87154.1 MAG: alpha/beta hydrolase [Pelagibacteraceae bacterium TMED136]